MPLFMVKLLKYILDGGVQMGFLTDSIIDALNDMKKNYEPALVGVPYYASGCGCTGNCGQSCSGDCLAGCTGNCGRSCSGSGS